MLYAIFYNFIHATLNHIQLLLFPCSLRFTDEWHSSAHQLFLHVPDDWHLGYRFLILQTMLYLWTEVLEHGIRVSLRQTQEWSFGNWWVTSICNVLGMIKLLSGVDVPIYLFINSMWEIQLIYHLSIGRRCQSVECETRCSCGFNLHFLIANTGQLFFFGHFSFLFSKFPVHSFCTFSLFYCYVGSLYSEY